MATSIKTGLIITLLNNFPNNEFTYTNIIKALLFNRGIVYNYKNHRGFFATNLCEGNGFTPKGYLRRSGREPRYLDKLPNGKWTVKNV